MIVEHGEFFSEEIIQSEKKDGNWNQNGKDALCKLSDGTTGLGDSGNDVWCAGSYRRWSWADNRLHHRDESPETERLIFTNKKKERSQKIAPFLLPRVREPICVRDVASKFDFNKSILSVAPSISTAPFACNFFSSKLSIILCL